MKTCRVRFDSIEVKSKPSTLAVAIRQQKLSLFSYGVRVLFKSFEYEQQPSTLAVAIRQQKLTLFSFRVR